MAVGLECSMAIVDIGISIVALDPGVTTGLAVWDGMQQKLWWDQVPINLVTRGTRWARGRQGNGKPSAKNRDHKWTMDQEMGFGMHIAEVCTALGPLGVLVIEDFILGWGHGERGVVSSKREGLSPVRVTQSVLSVCALQGIFNGDAWRRFRELDMGGQDKRGVIVGKQWQGFGTKAERRLGLGRELGERVLAVRRWQDEQGGEVQTSEAGVLWNDGGWVYEISPVSNNGKAANGRRQEQMKRAGLWVAGKPHACDALSHLWFVAQRLGIQLPSRHESLDLGR